MRLFLGHDLGTSGLKSVLIDVDGRVIASAHASYPLARPRPGFVEQSPDDWWSAVCTTTQELVAKIEDASSIGAITFAGQMLSLVALDAHGVPTRPAVSWLDGRADEQAARFVRRFGGERMLHLIAGGSPTGKDIVAKIAWLEQHEPEVYRRTAAFTDATGALVARATGSLVIDVTAAGCTGMLDAGSRTWSRALALLAGFPLAKMPRLVSCTEVVGGVTEGAARALGVRPGTPVVMGMADIPAAAVGAGTTGPGEAHVYLGTSSWIGVSRSSPKNVPRAGIASVPAANDPGYLMIGESETAGACREWLASRLGLTSEELDPLGAESPPGANGLLFLPWLYGERSPFPDAQLRGGFVGLSLDHDRSDMVRAVYEGTALNLRAILDACASAGEPCASLRAIGGGARSDLWMQILADASSRTIERVAHPTLAGAIGAGLVGAVGVGAIGSVRATSSRIAVERRFLPDASTTSVYARAREAMIELAPALSRAARKLAPRR